MFSRGRSSFHRNMEANHRSFPEICVSNELPSSETNISRARWELTEFRLISHAQDCFRVTMAFYITWPGEGTATKGEKKEFPPSWNNALLAGYVTSGYKTTCFNKVRV